MESVEGKVSRWESGSKEPPRQRECLPSNLLDSYYSVGHKSSYDLPAPGVGLFFMSQSKEVFLCSVFYLFFLFFILFFLFSICFVFSFVCFLISI